MHGENSPEFHRFVLTCVSQSPLRCSPSFLEEGLISPLLVLLAPDRSPPPYMPTPGTCACMGHVRQYQKSCPRGDVVLGAAST